MRPVARRASNVQRSAVGSRQGRRCCRCCAPTATSGRCSSPRSSRSPATGSPTSRSSGWCRTSPTLPLLVTLVYVAQALPAFLMSTDRRPGRRPLRPAHDHPHGLVRAGRRRGRPAARRLAGHAVARVRLPVHDLRARLVRRAGGAGRHPQPGPQPGGAEARRACCSARCGARCSPSAPRSAASSPRCSVATSPFIANAARSSSRPASWR